MSENINKSSLFYECSPSTPTLPLHRQINPQSQIPPSNITKIEIQKPGKREGERRGRRRTKKEAPFAAAPTLSSLSNLPKTLSFVLPTFHTLDFSTLCFRNSTPFSSDCGHWRTSSAVSFELRSGAIPERRNLLRDSDCYSDLNLANFG